MTRDQMLDVILEDYVRNWVEIGNTDLLEEFLLCCSWSPLDNLTNAELKDWVKTYDDEQIQDLLESCGERRIRERKIWEAAQKRSEKLENDQKAIEPFK